MYRVTSGSAHIAAHSSKSSSRVASERSAARISRVGDQSEVESAEVRSWRSLIVFLNFARQPRQGQDFQDPRAIRE